MNIAGSIVALVTPMTDDGEIDEQHLRQLVDWQIDAGVHGIVAVGTTGESPTLNVEDHIKTVKIIVEQTAGRVPVIAGNGANCTREAIELTQGAVYVGADACLCVVPYYNKPTQEGLYQHFKAIAESFEIPQILYNVPGRTVTDLLPDTVARLAEIPNVIGIKEATGDLSRLAQIQSQVAEDFILLSGDDETALDFMKQGGHGVISVTANVAPAAMAKVCNLARQGNWAQAEAMNQTLMPLHQKLFVEANPIPVKWALHRMSRIGAGIRLPLTVLSEALQPAVEQALKSAGCID